MNKSKLLTLALAFFTLIGTASCQNQDKEMNNKKNTQKILFINGSPNPNGNTAQLAQTLLKGKTYGTLNLVEYRVNHYGQTLSGDQFDEVLTKSENKNEPHHIARYVLDLSQAFNKFYHSNPINVDEIEIKKDRLALTLAVTYAIETAMSIFGIQTPKQM